MNLIKRFLEESGYSKLISDRLATILIRMHEPGGEKETINLYWKQIKIINQINEEYREWQKQKQ